ncbi:MAG: hypothetical protein JWR86_2086 [Enterovirga sp.]|jgi:uncharacterized membrane protein YoaK (UPF0700 family)|nr:hypothetical protein [Enterovirga sp.]
MLAGYVDAVGFIELGGLFVSFMSGNSTRLATGIVDGSGAALTAATLVLLFVLGVVAGTLLGRTVPRWRRPAILILVAALLAGAAALDRHGLFAAAIAAAVLAMGAENTVFERDGEVQVGLTYMTGTLVKLGQRIAATLLGGERWGWMPYLLLWLGLVVGAVLGAAVHPWLGLGSLWIAAAAALVLAIPAAWREPARSA